MPQDNKMLTLILEKLSDIGERTASMAAEQRNMKEDLEEVKRQDTVQNQLLAEHIQGVQTQALRLDNEIASRKLMQESYDQLKSRVDKLEEPNKFLATGKKYLLWIAAVGGAIMAILKWFQP